MSQHDAFLDRMAGRLQELEQRIRGDAALGDAPRRELEAGLAALKERLQAMRRARHDLSEDQTLSFAQAFERLNASVGRVQSGADRPSVA